MRTKTAQALLWGEQLGWLHPAVVGEPADGRFLKRLARMRKNLGAYLSRGQMARPPELGTDGTAITSNWVFTADYMVTVPTVQSGAWWRDDRKAVVLILVSSDDKPHTVSLPFDAATHGLTGKLTSCEWVATEEPAEKPAAVPSESSWIREITLAPFAATAIEIEMVEGH
jgi:hypothetical protein